MVMMVCIPGQDGACWIKVDTLLAAHTTVEMSAGGEKKVTQKINVSQNN